LTLKAGDGDRLEVVHRVQRRHKREIDLVPWREIAGRGTRVRDLAAFEIAKMADVVRRLISACAREGRLARGRQHAVFGKDQVKRDRAAVLRFSPYAKMSCEPLAQLVPCVLVGGNGQADGGGGAGLWRSSGLRSLC